MVLDKLYIHEFGVQLNYFGTITAALTLGMKRMIVVAVVEKIRILGADNSQIGILERINM